MQNKKFLMDIKNFSKSWDRIDEYLGIKLKKNYRRILLCGVGGSALFGQVLNQLIESHTFQKVEIIQDSQLPPLVTNEDLIIISSYSGGTEETLGCFHEAFSKGFDIVVMASDGEAMELAEEHKLPLYRLPKGLMPRMCFVYQISALTAMLVSTGLLPESFADELASTGEAIGKHDLDESANKLAKHVKGSIPIVYASAKYQYLCRVTKIKFNENAKTQAFHNFFPELNHNELQGYERLVGNYTILMFTDENDSPRDKKRQEVTSQILEKKGIKIIQIPLVGESYMEKFFYGIYFGDLITYNLAIENGIDPEPIKIVEEYKSLLN